MKNILFVTLVMLVLFVGVASADQPPTVGDPACPPGGNQCYLTYLPLATVANCPDGLTWINGHCATIVTPPEPEQMELYQSWPSDLAPKGCNTQITIDWTKGANPPTMWGMTHRVNQTNQDSCGMMITYTNKGSLSTLVHLGEGEFCDPTSGACIDNKKWEGDNGTVTWISTVTAPNGEVLVRGSTFNK